MRLRRWKRALTIVTLVLPFFYTAFVVTDHFGLWDRLSGLNLVEQVLSRFELSYTPDASRPVRMGDPEWEPFLNLVRRYSKTTLRNDKQPRVFARFQASLSTRSPTQGTIESEWTAPSTPFAVIYRDWPTSDGGNISLEDWQYVGTIGDLRDWISKAKESRRFLVLDIFLGTFGPLLAIVIYLLDERRGSIG